MALSADIYARFAQPLRSVADYDLEAANVEGARQGNALRRLQLQQGQQQADAYTQGQQRSNALRGLVGGFGADEAANAAALLKGGFLKESQDYQEAGAKRKKDATAADLDAAKADKERLAAGLQKFEIIGQLMGGVRDQATYDQARQAAAQQFGPEFAAKIPPQYDPAQIAQSQSQAMSVKERMEQEWKAKGYDREMAADAETRRRNQATEANAAGQLKVSQGQLGVAQGNLGVSRARLAHDQTQPKGQIESDRGLVVDPRTGEAKQITVGGVPVGAKAGAAGSATESERTAGFLLQRIRDSERQLDTVTSANKGAAKPGLAQETARLVSEPLANSVTGADRQRVESAQLDILDAALTLGTGAAYTREQLLGYRKSYFPQIGDSDAAIADKKQRLQNLIRAAETKAGRAAKDTAKPSGVSGGWTVTEVK